MKKILVIIYFLTSISGFAQQGWVYLNPTPTAASMNDLTMFTESFGICRSTNSIFRTYNGGATWMEFNLKNSEQYISCFSMVDTSIGFVITGSQNFLKTIDGGKTWGFVSTVPFYSRKLKFTSVNEGFVLTYEGSGGVKILKTIDGGLNWIEYFSDENNSVRDMHFVSSSVGYAVGSYPPNSVLHAKIFKTTNAGINWDSIPTSLRLASEKTFFINENTGFICGSVYNVYGNRFLRTTNGGVTWGDTLKYNLADIRFTNYNIGYFISGDSILGRTTNAGANWVISKIRNPTINYYTKPLQLCFVNQTNAICTGSLGLNLRTTDNGSTWLNYNYSFTSEELVDVEFKDYNTGLIMGWNHSYFKTTNGGQNWNKYNLGASNTELAAMSYAGGSTWYIASYNKHLVYKSTNDGITWDSSYLIPSQVTDFKFINENTGFGVCKYNIFFKTINGGTNWFVNTSIGSQNWAVNFIDENTGYINGGPGLRKTTDGGVSFYTVYDSIIYRGWDVKFRGRDTIFVAGLSPGVNYNIGTVWKSVNGGTNWTAYYIPSVGSIELYLRFTSSKVGYLNCGSSSIYKTTNSGDNWFLIKAPEYSNYNSTAGMHFIDSVTGYIVGNLGIIAKTTDGGASTFINANESVAKSFFLFQNYPNPFNPSTKIKFVLPKNENITIIVFDILGRKLETLLDENLTAGEHEVNWNASRYSAGVYFYMLLTDGIKETKKMILIK